jgi:hypothetical protein
MLLFLLGMLTSDGPARRNGSRYRAGGPLGRLAPHPADTDPQWPGSDAGERGQTRPLPLPRTRAAGGHPQRRVEQGALRAHPGGRRGDGGASRGHPVDGRAEAAAWRGGPAARRAEPDGWPDEPAAWRGGPDASRGDPLAWRGEADMWRGDPDAWRGEPDEQPGERNGWRRGPGGWRREPGGRRPRIPRWVKWSAVVVVIGLIFRRVIAAVVLMALSGVLHLVGISVHLPHIKLAWPWQTVTAGVTTNTDLGPWVLQKIEGISRPALGEANFTFAFTHKVSKNIGFWPCWYASTFYAVAHASATVDLNPGPAWWAPAAGHYRLRVLSRPGAGKTGHVAVTMVLPLPQLPQSAHDVTIDNIPSKPIATQHSWTYPGFGCGVLLRPQFPDSVLYAEAQTIAFAKAQHAPDITRQLVSAAETQAVQTIRDNFIQPTVNAFGYALDRFTIRWAAAP